MRRLQFTTPLLCAFLTPLIGLVVLGLPTAGHAHEIAILRSADVAVYNQAVAGFKAAAMPGMTFSEYDLEGSFEQGRKIARRLRASDASLVLAVGLKAALAARLEILDIPIVFCMVLDPDRYDLKAQNVTGITLEVPVERQFSTLRSVLPSVQKVGVLFDETKTLGLVEDARRLAKNLGLRLVEGKVRSEKEVPSVLRTLIGKIDALWLIPDSTVLTQDSFRFLLGTALDHDVPIIGFSSEFVRSGALVGLSVSYEDVGRQAAELSSRILAGRETIRARAIPPERVLISLNLKTAKYLGIQIPPGIVSRADEVY